MDVAGLSLAFDETLDGQISADLQLLDIGVQESGPFTTTCGVPSAGSLRLELYGVAESGLITCSAALPRCTARRGCDAVRHRRLAHAAATSNYFACIFGDRKGERSLKMLAKLGNKPADPTSTLLGHLAKGKREGRRALRGPRKPESIAVQPKRGRVEVAVRRPRVVGKVIPRAAAQHSDRAGGRTGGVQTQATEVVRV